MQEKRIDDYLNIDGSRDLSDPWDRFHTIYSVGRKTSRRKNVVRGEIDEKTADIQARPSMARTLENNGKKFIARNLENNGKKRQAEGEAKVVE